MQASATPLTIAQPAVLDRVSAPGVAFRGCGVCDEFVNDLDQ